MPSNEKIAIAAHLHVLLRRKTGRVTDTEWLATNREYAAEIIRFAQTKAVEDGHSDLTVWAEKLEEVMATPEPKKRVPLVQMLPVKMLPTISHERHLHSLAVPPIPDSQSARMVDTEAEAYPESGFIESTVSSFFGDSEAQRLRKQRDSNAPRYVKGLR